jgi:hypothetical protein
MFVESINSYERDIGEYECACRDSLSSGIAHSLRNSVASVRELEKSCETAKRRLEESMERGRELNRRKSAIMSRISRFLPSEIISRIQNGHSDLVVGRKMPISVSRVYEYRNVNTTESSYAQSASIANYGVKEINQSHSECKEFVMNEKDKKTIEKNGFALNTFRVIREELSKADSLVASIEDGSRSLEELTENISRMNDVKMVESRDIADFNARQKGAEEILKALDELLSQLDANQSKLQLAEIEARNINVAMSSVCPELERFDKFWHGLSGAVKKVMRRSALILSQSQRDKARLVKVRKQNGAMIHEAKAIVRDWGVIQNNLAVEVRDALERKKKRESLAVVVLNKTRELSSLLANLSGRDQNDFISYMRIEDGMQLPVLSQNADALGMFSEALSNRAKILTEIGTKCRDFQPAIDSLGEENINLSSVFPPYISYGDVETSVLAGKRVSVPMACEFPFSSSFIFDDSATVIPFLIRILYSLPVGKFMVSAIDHKDIGDNIGALNALCNVGILRIVTGSDDIAAVLHEYDNLMGDMVRHGILSAKDNDWITYNINHPEETLPFRVLVIYSMSGFTPAQLETLHKILANGSRFGIVCVLAARAKDDLDERLRNRHEEFLEGIRLNRIGRSGSELTEFSHLRLSVSKMELDALKVGDIVDRYLSTYNNVKKAPVREIKFDALFENVRFWGENTIEGLSASIGWDVRGNPVNFEFGVGTGASAYHALVGGTTGSGKSVFLHTLIQSLSYKYSPDELEFYLLDYKKGDEFKKYADIEGNAWLPHVKMISRHKDPRFALELFDFLDREFKRRSECFGGYGDIVSYRKSGGKIPRIVIVIDEFQVMFEEYYGLNLSEEVAKRLSTVFRQGRSYGIHIVLATQSLASLHFSGMSSILGQIGLRIALKGTANDGILADGNRAAETIIPKQQCIVNTAFGAKDSESSINNVVTNVPFSDPAQVEECKKIRKEIENASSSAGRKASCRVFNGAELPCLPSEGEVASVLAPIKWNTLFTVLVGARTDFVSSPFPVAFSEMQREHLLIAGEDGDLSPDFEVRISGEDVWEGLRRGIIRSLGRFDSCKVLYYNPGVGELPAGIPEDFLSLTGRAGDAELINAFKTMESSGCDRKIVIVENFQEARLLHPGDAPRMSFQSRSPEQVLETSASVFSSLFNGTANPKFHVIIMTKNFSFMNKEVLARSGAETNILKGCGKRIAFNLSDDDLGVMIPHLKSQDRRGPRRVWFEDVSNGQVVDFLPYGN